MWITFADFRQMHDAVVNMTKIVLHVFGADGNEIGGVAAAIPPGRAGGRDSVFVLVFIGH